MAVRRGKQGRGHLVREARAQDRNMDGLQLAGWKMLSNRLNQRLQARGTVVYGRDKKAPADQVYPLMLNVATKSQTELTGGTSRINAYNVAAIVDHMV